MRSTFVRSLLAAAVLAVAPAAATAAPGPPAPGDVTLVPQVQLDLGLAKAYWQVVTPGLTAPCSPEYVTVGPMMAGVGAGGQSVSAAAVWAETAIGACTITLSPSLWTYAQSAPRNLPVTVAGRVVSARRMAETMLCAVITHEYGHTLGLPDDNGNDMMNTGVGAWPQGRQQALCALAYRLPLTRYEKAWLAEREQN
jgi:hypothetical protein